MKNNFFLILCIIVTQNAMSQVGVGTSTPESSAILDVSATDKGILFPRLTTAQRIAIASPAPGLYVFDVTTSSLWYYNGSIWINTASEAVLGDVKSGFQSTDHSGWVILDGRSVNSLTSNQQIIAESLGFTTNIPDATSAYLVQNNNIMGGVSGENSTILTQSNLPNVSFNGTSESSGAHTHTIDPAGVSTSSDGNHTHGSNASGSQGLAFRNGNNTTTGLDSGQANELNLVTLVNLSIYAGGVHSHTVDIPSTTSTISGDHTHNVAVSSGGAGTPVNIAPKSLSVNMFVFLGQ